ncbi:MAG: LysM peptidoglycan-binding domain-containing protein [Spirochaetales bacterium]|nr:LysM peptidoglycan-binding domain-containing protein [Spirochaetales bacterium]
MKKLLCNIFIIIMLGGSCLYSEDLTYIVKKGDTLFGISKRFNIRIDSLKKVNHLGDSAILFPGTKMIIPGGYTVQKGDTLYGIAKKFNTTVNELLDLNNIDMNVILKTGQFLHVPVTKENIAEKDVIKEAPVVEVAKEVKGNNLWPHSGSRTELKGKLKGIQIDGKPGDSIVSVNTGRVVWASDYGIYKKLILIEGKNGLVYGYGGNETAKVKVGDYVKSGSIIGVLGGTQDETAAFFFVYKNGKPVDPVKAPRV